MAAQLYYSPFIPAFSPTGAPVPGAKLYFFLTGTNTLAPVYAESSLSTPLGNPVVANLAGRFPPIYMDSSLTYRVRQTTGDDVPLGSDIDDYIPGQALRGPTGLTGPANSTFTTLTSLKAALYTNSSFVFAPPSGSESGIPAAVFYYRAGDFSSRPDGPGFVKLNSGGAVFAQRQATVIPNIDTSVDVATSLQAVIDSATFGDVIRLPRDTYQMSKAVVVKPGITLDLNWSTLVLNLNGGNLRGITPRSYSEVCNGTINVNSSGQPSLQAGVHSPVTVGPLYGDSPSIAGISPEENVTGFRLRNLTLSTNKLASENGSYPVGGVGIQVYGNSSAGVIENITIPDNDRMFGVIHLDWAPVGYIVSNDIPGSRSAFDSNAAYTTHPHNIVIRNVTAGRLSRAVGGIEGGSHGIRMSAVYAVSVENVQIGATTYATVLHTGGDVGFEFAKDVDRRQAYQNITVRDVSCPDNGPDGRLLQSDTLADNVYRATVNNGYSALLPMPHPTNMVMERIAGRASGTVGLNSVGVRVIQQSGGVFRDCISVGHLLGHMIGDQSVGVVYERPQANLNRYEAIYVGEGSQTPPQRCSVISPVVSLANRANANRAVVFVGRSNLTRISGGTIGSASGETGKFGIQIDTAQNGCTSAVIDGNPIVLGHAPGGAAFSVSSDEGWGALRIFQGGATYGSGVTTQWVGLSIVPIEVDSSLGGTRVRYRANRSKLSSDTTPPASFPGNIGDRIEFVNPTSTASKTVCTASGTPGTWFASP